MQGCEAATGHKTNSTQRLFANKRKYRHNSTTLNGRLPEKPKPIVSVERICYGTVRNTLRSLVGEKSYKISECDEQIDRLHVLTTLTIWLTDRWSSVRVKLTLTNGQGFLQRAHT